MPLPEVGRNHDTVVVEKHVDAIVDVVGAAATEVGAPIHNLAVLPLCQRTCLYAVQSDVVLHRVLVGHAAENRCRMDAAAAATLRL